MKETKDIKNYETLEEWVERMGRKATIAVCYIMATGMGIGVIAHMAAARWATAGIFALMGGAVLAIGYLTKREDKA